jgi:hypothetical protein
MKNDVSEGHVGSVEEISFRDWEVTNSNPSRDHGCLKPKTGIAHSSRAWHLKLSIFSCLDRRIL